MNSNFEKSQPAFFYLYNIFPRQTNNWQSNVENVNIPLNILTSNIELCRLVYANMKC